MAIILHVSHLMRIPLQWRLVRQFHCSFAKIVLTSYFFITHKCRRGKLGQKIWTVQFVNRQPARDKNLIYETRRD